MKTFEGNLGSKLTRVGTSIFAVMSQIANEHKAVNLSQGFPDFSVFEKLIERIHYYMKNGFNQYAPMPGVPVLRKQIKKSRFKIVPTYGTYFQLLDYSEISDENEMDFSIRLIKKYGIASVPTSPFYHNVKETKRLRFCFAKEKETLNKASEILCKI